MQLLPILLVAVVMAVDEGLHPIGARWELSRGLVAALANAPVVVIVLLATLAVARCERQLRAGRVPGPIIWADRCVRYARTLIVLNHAAAVLVFGWLGAVRSVTGDLIMLDELIAIAPALLGLTATWWAYYPIEVRLRDALTIRRLDDGVPLYPMLTRWQYVFTQVRVHVLVLLVPILLIASAVETIDTLWRHADPPWPDWLRGIATFASAAGIFLIAPLLARVLLDTEPLAPGSLRDALTDVCRRHRVRIRELLLWKTNGSMINAAVMGLVGPLRYVMITDALLESMRLDQAQAVMAHEIGHVRRHHMPWMIISLAAAFVLAVYITELPLRAIDAMGLVRSQTVADTFGVASMVAQLVLGLLMFGWISRRFERQADTFAVQHLSGMGLSPAEQSQTRLPHCETDEADIDPHATHKANADHADDESESAVAPDLQELESHAAAHAAAATDGAPRITIEAVNAMSDALGTIAKLNTIDPKRPSWRHGSITWRQRYLRSLVGQPIDQLRIDQTVRWIKRAAAIVLLSALAYESYAGWQASSQAPICPADAGAAELWRQVADDVRAKVES